MALDTALGGVSAVRGDWALHATTVYLHTMHMQSTQCVVLKPHHGYATA